jgi:hypothetical protein
MFARRSVDEEEPDEDEVSGIEPADPLALFHDPNWYQPPRPMTPVIFRSYEPEVEDLADHFPKIIHEINAGPHMVRLMLRQDESIERIIEVLRRRTGITGTWNGTITAEGSIKDGTPRRVALTPVQITAPAGLPEKIQEVRVFFGTLERKGSAPQDASPEQAMRKLAD